MDTSHAHWLTILARDSVEHFQERFWMWSAIWFLVILGGVLIMGILGLLPRFSAVAHDLWCGFWCGLLGCDDYQTKCQDRDPTYLR